MGDQPTDLWEERALPIVRYIAAHETDMGFISIGDLSAALGNPFFGGPAPQWEQVKPNSSGGEN